MTSIMSEGNHALVPTWRLRPHGVCAYMERRLVETNVGDAYMYRKLFDIQQKAVMSI